MKLSLKLAVLLVLIISCFTVSAHTLSPAVATIIFDDATRFRLEVLTNAEALLADIGPQHGDTEDAPTAQFYNKLRQFTPEKLKVEFAAFAPIYLKQIGFRFGTERPYLSYRHIDVPPVGDVDLVRKSLILISGTVLKTAGQFIWHYPEKLGSIVLKVRFSGEELAKSFWLKAGSPPLKIKLDQVVMPRSRIQIAKDYIVLGFTHIVPKGLDHILFVIGIFLFSLKLSSILWQVTAFTIAHTITLGLTIYGYVSLSPSIVEPLIALSIVYVGIENMLTNKLRPWRVVVVFVFGLLHGMGFAGVLTGIGLPPSESFTALITFNVGVELGQLAVIAIAFLVVGWCRHKPWYRQWVVMPASLAIACMGLFWTWERAFS